MALTKIPPSGINTTALNIDKIIKVTQVVKTDTFTTSTTSWVDIPGLSITVTPASINSKFLLVCDLSMGPNSGAGSFSQRFAKNGAVITEYIGDAAGSRPRSSGLAYGGDNAGAATNINSTKMYLDSPGTLSNITYTLQLAGSTTVPGYLNRTTADRDTATYDGRTVSSFTIFEIGA